MKPYIIFFFGIFFVGVISCKNARQESKKEPINNQQIPITAKDQTIKNETEKMQAPNTAEFTEWNKKIIKKAVIKAEIKDSRKFFSGLTEQCKRTGAYILNEEQHETSERIENTILIKVPVDKFEDLLIYLNEPDVVLLEKKISGEDVSAEMIDVKSRIATKEAVRNKYYDLLKQARNMDEILRLQSELNQMQEEIEAANGRLNYLMHSAQFSTIELTYFETKNEAMNGEKGFFSKMATSFSIGWNWVLNVLTFLITLWPLWIALLVSRFIYLRIKRKFP